MPSTITKRLLGVMSVSAWQKTEPHYEMRWTPDTPSVVTGLSAKVTSPTSPDALRTILYASPRRPGLIPPVPNYRIDWGVKGFSTAPLDSFFRNANLNQAFAFEPIPACGVPVGLPGDEFIVRLDGTPVQVAEGLGIEFYIETRPMNS